MLLHSQGIVHRDIKPANIFVTSVGMQRSLWIGEGVSPAASSSSQIAALNTQTGIGGCRASDQSGHAWSVRWLYMSPEQVGRKSWMGGAICSPSCCAVRDGDGHAAFRGETSAVISEGILNRAPVPALRLNPDLPP